MEFINTLKPEFKKQFLNSALRRVSEDIESAKKLLKEVSIDEIIELLSVVNEQKVAIPEAIKRLGDNRWFVKRNMIYILSECNSTEILPHVRPYCRHKNRKVRFEAIKCLLNARDSYGIEAVYRSLKNYPYSEIKDFIDIGLKSKDEFIREESLRLSRKAVLDGNN
jgi:HEAT repeat protein